MVNYIDDILIFPKNYQEHKKHIKLILQALHKKGFKLNPSKCQFAQEKVTYLGHKISYNQIEPVHDNLVAIKKFPTPQDRKNIRQFLGKINFYLEFIPRASILLEPFHHLLRKDVKFYWSEECQNNFDLVKEYLCSCLVLAIFNPDAPTYICTDASIKGVSATLKQEQKDKSLKPVFYFSKKLNKTQKTKRAIYIECVVIKEAILYWQNHLMGKKFLVWTDHEPLENFNVKNSKNSELLQVLNYISQFNFEIKYNPGKNNVEADCLSRNPVLEADYEMESAIKTVNSLKMEEIITNQKLL